MAPDASDAHGPAEPADHAATLERGELEILGRLPWSSNASFVVEACWQGDETLAVYKPVRGERPLWDFPPGLHRREVAAWVVSEELGWGLVPRTVARDGPYGEGSVQQFVDADHAEHYFTLFDAGDEAVLAQLRTVCAFDLVINNTDRKSGHCLVDGQGHLWGIDHGLAFHAQCKLRTVIWDFAGEAIPEPLRRAAERFAAAPLPTVLDELLDPFERDALVARARALAEASEFPSDPSGRRVPWPLV